MRAIPSNIMAGFLGLGYDADGSEVYDTTALDYKCIGYWRFSENTEYTGSSIVKEVISSAPFGINGLFSTVGATHSTADNMLSANGTSGRVNFGNYYNFSLNEPMSLQVWASFRTTNIDTFGAIISKGGTANGDRGYSFGFDPNGWVFFELRIDSTSQFIRIASTINSITTGSTNHLVVTYDGSRSSTGIHLYVNGSTVNVIRTEKVTTSYRDDELLNNSDFNFFSRGSRYDQLSGTMREPAIWNRELSSSNVVALYNGGSGTTISFINHIPDVAYMNHMVVMELGSGSKYYTNSDINIVYSDGTGNQTYLSRGLTIPSIEYSASPSIDQMSIEFDNVDLEFSQMVLGEEVRGKTVKIYLANLNKVPQVLSRDLLFLGIIESVDVNRDKATFNLLSHMYLWQKKIPKRNHSARCQWTFKDSATCKYAGSDPDCDKSWDDCDSSNKNNAVNFGGFRWLPSIMNRQIWWGRIPS